MQMRPIELQARTKTVELIKEINQAEEAKEKSAQALETIGKIEELFDNQELHNVFIRNAVLELQGEP